MGTIENFYEIYSDVPGMDKIKKVISQNIDTSKLFFERLPLIQGIGGVTIDKGVYFPSDQFLRIGMAESKLKNKSQIRERFFFGDKDKEDTPKPKIDPKFFSKLFVIFHEMGHFKRISEGMASPNDLLGLLNNETEFKAYVLKEEKAANWFAKELLSHLSEYINVWTSIPNEAGNLSNTSERPDALDFSYKLYGHLNNIMSQSRNSNFGDLVLDFVRGKIR